VLSVRRAEDGGTPATGREEGKEKAGKQEGGDYLDLGR
jgi:hypothetical protein